MTSTRPQALDDPGFSTGAKDAIAHRATVQKSRPVNTSTPDHLARTGIQEKS